MLRILHCADLHLDSPFASLPPELAAARREQQLQMLGELTALCRKADLVLLAGDVLDARQARPETVALLQERFAQWQVPVCISPGNHDPFTADSIWNTARWPENVHIFSGPMTAVTLPELQCRVWGAAFRERESDGLLRAIPKADDGYLEIGVLHGDPVNPGPYGYLPAETIRDCGLDYLALGHIHRAALPRKLGRTWYGWPGAAMGRGVDETGEKGVFLVELEQERCRTEFVPLPLPRYETLSVDVQAPELPPVYDGSICRLILTGECERPDVAALHRQLAARFLYLELVDRTTPLEDLWRGMGDGTLRGRTMEALRAQYDRAQTEEDRQTALLAARYARAALEGREEP